MDEEDGEEEEEEDDTIYLQITRPRSRTTPKKRKPIESPANTHTTETTASEASIIGTEFVDGLEYVTNILTDHVIPYVCVQ